VLTAGKATAAAVIAIMNFFIIPAPSLPYQRRIARPGVDFATLRAVRAASRSVATGR
jgi:hypothetical protein